MELFDRCNSQVPSMIIANELRGDAPCVEKTVLCSTN